MDCDSPTVDAVENPVGLESHFSKLRDADVLQLWWDVAPKRQRAQRVTSLFETLKQTICLLDGIVQRNVLVDFKEVFLGIKIKLNIMLFHS
jgi:hypothetical protein